MTFLEKWKEDMDIASLAELGCPSHYGYEDKRGKECDGKCVECWDREMPNTEFKQKVVNPPSQETLDFIHDNIEVLEGAEVSFTDDLLNQGYTKGINDCIEYIRKLFTITEGTRKKLFGCREIRYIIDKQDVQSIITKLKEYEELQKLKVGDVLKMFDHYCVVTKVDQEDEEFDILWNGGCTNTTQFSSLKNFTKTGKHIDVQKIFDQIGE